VEIGLLNLLFSVWCLIWALFVLLAVVLSVLRYTASDKPFGIVAGSHQLSTILVK